jgi:LPXTG-motif cell wall-anchored protein
MKGTGKKLKFFLALTLVIVLAFGTTFAVFAANPNLCTGPLVSPVTGDSVPQYFAGWTQPNPNPIHLPKPEGCTLIRFKVDRNQYQIPNGTTYTNTDGFAVTIYKKQVSGKYYFAFVSNYPVFHVYAKGGNQGGNLYSYYPTYQSGVYSDCGLSQPGGNWSHIAFYYCRPAPPPPPPETVSLVVYKFNDVNEDGSFNNEPLLSGWTFTVSADNENDRTGTTDTGGYVTFTDLTAGKEYTVTETTQTDWTVSTANPQTITISSGTGVLWFGNYYDPSPPPDPKGSISGTKYNNFNEEPLAGWTIKLFKDTLPGNPATAEAFAEITTDDDGNYSFTNLEPGTYYVYEVQQSGWTAVYPEEGYHQIVIPFVSETLNHNEPIYDITEVDFWNQPPPETVSLVVYKFNDLDQNGSFSCSEPLLSGWTFTVSASAGNENDRTGTTDTGGYVTFTDLTAGKEYTVTETTQIGWTVSTANPQTITISSGTGVLWFGNYQPEEPETVTVVVYKEFEEGSAGDAEHLFPVTLIPVPVNGDYQLKALNGTESDVISGYVSVNVPWEVTSGYPGLTPGWYEIVEDPGDCEWVNVYTDSEEGCYKDEETGQWFVLIPESGSVAITLVNSCPEHGSTSITVTKRLDGGNPTQDFHFTLYKSVTDGSDIVVGSGMLAKDQSITFYDLALDEKYYVVETMPLPTYYYLVSVSDPVTLTEENRTGTIIITNRYNPPPPPPPPPPPGPDPGTLKVFKVMQGDGDPAKTFRINVRNAAGSVVAHGDVSVNNSLTFTLNPGNYEVEEVTPDPPYYLVSQQKVNVQVNANTEVSVTFTNRFEETIITIQGEPAAVEEEIEPELPRTGGNDIILLALAAVLAGSGLALRRKRK